MFKKLKTRLTLLNLAIAGVILVTISIMAYVLISSNVESQSLQTFRLLLNNMASQQNAAIPPPAMIMSVKEKDGVLIPVSPYYIIDMNENSASISINSDMPPDALNQIIASALQGQVNAQNKLGIANSNGNTVTVTSYTGTQNTVRVDGTTYRYGSIFSSTGDVRIAIQDLSAENDLLTSIGVILFACVAGGLVLLFFGGRYLAERSIRPIRTSWQKQREFVADASHELRTPLAAIMSNIEVVLDDPAATVQEKQVYCQGIAEESRRMTQLVDGLLLLARADSDAVVFQYEPVNLGDLATSASAFLRPAAAKKQIEISLQINSEPETEGDPDRLKEVLIQLLDNAIKYTPEGGHITVSVDQVRDMAKIRVADNGTGIAKENLEKIFERFYREDASRERDVGGYGLGLSIARFIIERHGGSLTAASEPGQGSVFTVCLPAK